jgi:toxin ParE1/3/4
VRKADDYLREIDEAIGRLADNPGLGADYSHVLTGIRRYSIRRHRIFYRVDAQSLKIIRVLHERMEAYQQVAGDDEPAA